MALEFVESDFQSTLVRGNSIGIVPLCQVSGCSIYCRWKVTNLLVHCHAVPEVNRLEVWIVVVVKCTSRLVELVRELFHVS